MKKHIKLAALAMGLAVLVGGCGKGDEVTKQEIGGWTLAMSTQPHPPRVGEAAQVTLSVQSSGSVREHCKVHFRQYMAGHTMDGDTLQMEMLPSKERGTYVGKSREFSMGGDWSMEFTTTCGQATQTATFPLHLEWPE